MRKSDGVEYALKVVRKKGMDEYNHNRRAYIRIDNSSCAISIGDVYSLYNFKDMDFINDLETGEEMSRSLLKM